MNQLPHNTVYYSLGGGHSSPARLQGDGWCSWRAGINQVKLVLICFLNLSFITFFYYVYILLIKKFKSVSRLFGHTGLLVNLVIYPMNLVILLQQLFIIIHKTHIQYWCRAIFRRMLFNKREADAYNSLYKPQFTFILYCKTKLTLRAS